MPEHLPAVGAQQARGFLFLRALLRVRAEKEAARRARYAIDATKLEDELGWKAQENFDSGIEKTVRWYLENQWWWQPLREQYDGQRLGLDSTAAKVPA